MIEIYGVLKLVVYNIVKFVIFDFEGMLNEDFEKIWCVMVLLVVNFVCVVLFVMVEVGGGIFIVFGVMVSLRGGVNFLVFVLVKVGLCSLI